MDASGAVPGAARARVRHLIGVGTATAGDDGVGLRVAEAIAVRGLDVGFRAVELSGNLLDLIHYLDEDVEDVLIVDAARMGLPAGDHAFFVPGDVRTRRELPGFSTHESDVLKVLALATALGRTLPRIAFLGIEPADTRPGLALSPPLERRFAEYVDAAVGYFAA